VGAPARRGWLEVRVRDICRLCPTIGTVLATPDAPHIFLDDQELLRAWNSPERVFLYAPQYERAKVGALLPGPLHVASEASGKVIFANHP
jgi:hypothetical protein